MFAASVFIAMVKFFLCISFDLQRERTKKRKKEPFFSNRELLSTRKHWTINRHIAFISFQLKISTPFRKLSTKKKKKKKKNTFHSITFLFCFNSKYHFNFLCVKIMDKWSQDVVDRRYNALKLSCMTTKYVFWSPIFSTPNHETAPTKHVTIPATLICAFYGFRHWTKPCSSRHTTRWNGV